MSAAPEMKSWLRRLSALHPCSEGFAYVETFDTPQAFWDACERPDWLLWLIGRTIEGEDRKKLVGVACACARLALHLTKDPRVLKCIETAEAWTRGEATIEEVHKARDADAAADAAAYAAAYARQAIKVQCCAIIRAAYPTIPQIEERAK